MVTSIASSVSKGGYENRACISDWRTHGCKEDPSEGSITSILGRLVQRRTQLLSELRGVREISPRGY